MRSRHANQLHLLYNRRTYILVQIDANPASPTYGQFTMTFPDGHAGYGPYRNMGGQVTSISEPNSDGSSNTVLFNYWYDEYKRSHHSSSGGRS